MEEQSLTPEVPLVDDYQYKDKKARRKSKLKNDGESKKARQIERQRVLHVLTASAIPLSTMQIQAEIGKISNPKLLIAYLKHQRYIEVAYRGKSPNGPFEQDYYRIIRPAPAVNGQNNG